MNLFKHKLYLLLAILVSAVLTSCHDDPEGDYYVDTKDVFALFVSLPDGGVPPDNYRNLFDQGTSEGVKIVRRTEKNGDPIECMYEIYVPKKGADITLVQSDSIQSYIPGPEYDELLSCIHFLPDIVYDDRDGHGVDGNYYYVSYDPSIAPPYIRGNVIRSPFGEFYEGYKSIHIRISKSSKKRQFGACYQLRGSTGELLLHPLTLTFHQPG